MKQKHPCSIPETGDDAADRNLGEPALAPKTQDLVQDLAEGGRLHFRMPDASAPGMRLDAALGLAVPGLGLRARRRLWEWCAIKVNGFPAKPGTALGPGDIISIAASRPDRRPSDSEPAQDKDPPAADRPRIPEYIMPVAGNKDFLVFSKKEGIHSARIAGSRASSFEASLERYWPELMRGQAENAADLGMVPLTPATRGFSVPRLMTRLDKGTSGLLLAARHEAAAMRFRDLEKNGEVRKTYLALVHGHVPAPLYLTGKLDTADSKASRVLPVPDRDEARHTAVWPVRPLERDEILSLCAFSETPVTLVRVEIKRGARHQIRAHLAHAGHPIAGEQLYAEDASPRLFLHHAKLDLPGFSAALPPDWGILSALPT